MPEKSATVVQLKDMQEVALSVHPEAELCRRPTEGCWHVYPELKHRRKEIAINPPKIWKAIKDVATTKIKVEATFRFLKLQRKILSKQKPTILGCVTKFRLWENPSQTPFSSAEPPGRGPATRHKWRSSVQMQQRFKGGLKSQCHINTQWWPPEWHASHDSYSCCLWVQQHNQK